MHASRSMLHVGTPTSSSSITIKILPILKHEFPSKQLYKSRLITTLHDFMANWDNKNQLDAVVLYSANAFDIVPP